MARVRRAIEPAAPVSLTVPPAAAADVRNAIVGRARALERRATALQGLPAQQLLMERARHLRGLAAEVPR